MQSPPIIFRTTRKRGQLRIIKRSNSGSTVGKQNVFVKCVVEDKEHKMQLFTDSDYQHSYGHLNLKKCSVSLLKDAKMISISKSPELRRRGGPSQDMIFQAKNEESAGDWVTSLSERSTIPETISEANEA